MPQKRPDRRETPQTGGGVPEADPRVPDPATRTEGEGETLDMPEGFESFTPGQVLGERYQILEMLGRGGMGEVWHAFDLKLRVEVALKALREDLFKSERRLELLRQEVRAAREVMSPNVCRIFDLIEVEGRELVSMEYVDGATLLGVLQERGPLELKEAQDIASQFLAGLEAIHKVGLIHRDIKPENIMLTRAGRVVLMDFGLARQEDSGAGTVSGTPAYMAPEQAMGGKVDARADVYSAGVVLAEMVSPEGIRDLQSRQSVWEGVRHEPARVPDSPWAPVLKKAVAKEPDQRYNSAHTLTRALEDVTLRVEGAEDLTPYPGLASFTEEDAEYFFGREAEVEAMWRRLEGAHLLATVGPSGAGKSSFIRAGLIPKASPGWSCVVCTPGNAAFLSLGRALIPELSGDTEAMESLLQVEDPDAMVSAVSRWRKHHRQALLIVDQFEELFTQNPAGERTRFADLLGRLVLEADVRVLLSMRDDFLMQCKLYEPLLPLFESLVPLMPPAGHALRRALVQPATKCGYRFEDDELVDEMLVEVEGERGALPLLAFAMSRLWEKRDRENGLLTRRAYHDIGGVGGALARHAEATLDSIGVERMPIVRELFRNLVTPEGTRAVREWNELLSIFSDSHSESPEEVLRQLIDARLLTSYEVHAEDEEPTRRVEIIHESLLANWPRLVGWQTQDADSVRLRDELRQAARTWNEHERSDDLLWTGSAYREFAVWRDRYPGGLTETEEAFAAAMTIFVGRRRRRRRMIVAAVMAALIVGLVVVGSFWQRSVRETRRAEAAKLVTLGQMQLQDVFESDPTLSIAFALASLTLADSRDARFLALEALWRRPPRLQIQTKNNWGVGFSPDGRQLAVGSQGELIRIWRSSGGAPTLLRTENPDDSWVTWVRFAAESGLLFSSTSYPGHGAQMWSLPDMRVLRSFDCAGLFTLGRLREDGRQLVTSTMSEDRSRITLRAWPLPEGGPIELGDLPLDGRPDIDPTASWIAYPSGADLFLLPLGNLEDRNAVPVARHDHPITFVAFDQQGTRIAAADDSGEVRMWSAAESPAKLLRTLDKSCLTAEIDGLTFNHDGSLLAVDCSDRVKLWDLDGPPDAAPLELAFDGASNGAAFDPRGRWIAVTHWDATGMWPLDRRYPSVMLGHEPTTVSVVFAPDGSWLGSASWDGTVRLWPLSSTGGLRGRILFSKEGRRGRVPSLAVTPDGQSLVAGTHGGEIWLVPVNGDSPRLVGRTNDFVWAIAISPDGRTIATGGGFSNPAERVIRLWDLDSGRQRHLDPGDERGVSDLEFVRDGRLLSASEGTLRRWNLEDDSSEVLMEEGVTTFDLSADELGVLSRSGPTFGPGSLRYLSLVDGGWQDLPGFGRGKKAVALDPTGTIAVTGSTAGTLRVGLITGGDSQVLYGHSRQVWDVAVSPDGRWIASGGEDGAVRLWPMPDLSKPPLHTLPHEELIAKLKTLTNLRVVRNPESNTGWKLEVGPLPGWETVPTW